MVSAPITRAIYQPSEREMPPCSWLWRGAEFRFSQKKYSIKEGREDFFEDEQVRLKVNPSHS